MGISLWLLAFMCFSVLNGGWLPLSITKLPVAKALTGYCALIALPVPLLGWIYVWGDNGPPFVEYPFFNIVFGILFYGLLGAVLGSLAALIRHRRFTLKAMLVVFTLFAVVLGLVSGVMTLLRNWRAI